MDIDAYIKNNSLTVYVTPNAAKNRVTGYDEKRSAVSVDVREKAENNKANEAVIRLIARLTGRQVKIIRGKTGRLKILKIA